MGFEFKRASSVVANRDFTIDVTFKEEGVIKRYDMNRLVKKYPVVERIKNDYELFQDVKLSPAGRFMYWDDDIDLGVNTIWYDGETIGEC